MVHVSFPKVLSEPLALGFSIGYSSAVTMTAEATFVGVRMAVVWEWRTPYVFIVLGCPLYLTF